MKIVRRVLVLDCQDFNMRLLALIDARYVHQAWLAKRLGLEANRFNDMLVKKSVIDIVVVSEIERAMGIDHDFWSKPWADCVVQLVRMKRETEAGLFKGAILPARPPVEKKRSPSAVKRRAEQRAERGGKSA